MNTGLKNTTKVSRLNISGSADIYTKNDFGVHVFANMVDDDGIVFGKLTKPKYNTTELQNTINTSIYELIPKPYIQPPDSVPRSVLNEELLAHGESKKIIAIRDTTITNLNNTINILNATVDSLNVQLDAQSLIAASAQNQSQQSMTRVKTNITELQNATQKSISEVIGRVSAEARNKSLEDDISSLTDQLVGRSAKAQEGFQLGTGFAVKVNSKSDITHSGMVYRYKSTNITETHQWLNGPVVEIANYTNISTTFTLSSEVPFSGITGVLNGKITIPARSSKLITFSADDAVIAANYYAGSDTEFIGNITVKSNQSSGPVLIQIVLQSQTDEIFGQTPVITIL